MSHNLILKLVSYLPRFYLHQQSLWRHRQWHDVVLRFQSLDGLRVVVSRHSPNAFVAVGNVQLTTIVSADNRQMRLFHSAMYNWQPLWNRNSWRWPDRVSRCAYIHKVFWTGSWKPEVEQQI